MPGNISQVKKNPALRPGFSLPGWRLGVDIAGLVAHRNQVIQARPVGVIFVK